MDETIGSNFNITPPDIGIGSSRQHKATKHLGFATLAATCASLAAFSTGVYADTVGSDSQEVGGRLAPNSVTVSTDGNVSIDIVRNANPTLAVGKGTVTVTAGSGGYQLYISGTNTGSNGYTSLYYDGDINSSSKIEGFNVDTPTAFSSAHTNQWGYAVASEVAAETGFSAASTYNSILATGATVDTPTINNLKWKGINNNYKLIRTTNSAVSNNTTDVYYGIYTNSADLMAGNYKNSVVYTAFVDGANTINITPFNVGNNDTMTITAEYQSSQFPVPDASRISVNLRDGGTSVGTCDNVNIVDNGGSSNLLKFTCTVHTNASFQAGKALDATVTVKMPNTNSELSYTAEDAWGSYITMADSVDMQDMSTWSCKNAELYSSSNKTYQLKDNRTAKSYLIRKLDDGNCWMVQNLWLEGGKTIITQNGTNYALPTSSTSGYTSSDTSAASMYSGTHSDNTTDSNSNTGSFFSWMAATAGTGNGGTTARNSVCPKGWRLPTSGDNGEFKTLYATAYSNNYSNFNTVWSGSPIGYCSNSSCTSSQGSYARWWSATQNNKDYGYSMVMHINNSAFYSSDSSSKYIGISVRCMLSGN